jgi:soluble lytic murein transglycosylase-like protein
MVRVAAMLLCWAAAGSPGLAADGSSTQSLLAQLEAVPSGTVSGANRRRLAPHIERIARRYRVDPALVSAVIAAESGFDPRAVSPRGAVGLMQLLPSTARDYGVEDPFEPIANITAGTRHLGRLLKKYKNISHALAAYNAGEGSMDASRRSIAWVETRKYVVRVINFYRRYKGS